MAKQRVVLAHGINTSGDWQERARSVLEPHFTCVLFKYSDYRWFGETKIVGEPLALLTSAVALPLGIASGGMQRAICLLVFVAGLVAAIVLRVVRRQRVLRSFKIELDRYCGPGERPHLIAHSFGTFLTGSILRKYPNINLERVILLGCVLPPQFDWTAVFRNNPFAFTHVRNEVGKCDTVVKLAHRVGSFTRLGGAGVLGFEPNADFVHSIQSPFGECTQCSGLVRARVHNVFHDFYGHSDAFVGPGHCETFWLPELWGIPPVEYQLFLELCVTAARYERTNFRLAALAEAELRERRWSWARGSLEHFVAELLGHRSGKRGRTAERLGISAIDPHLVSAAVRLVWLAVNDAVVERKKPRPRSAKVLALDPRIAVVRAVETMFRG